MKPSKEFKSVVVKRNGPVQTPSFDRIINSLIQENWQPVYESYHMTDTHVTIVLWRYIKYT